MRYLVTDIIWDAKPLDVARLPKTAEVEAGAGDEIVRKLEDEYGALVRSATSIPVRAEQELAPCGGDPTCSTHQGGMFGTDPKRECKRDLRRRAS